MRQQNGVPLIPKPPGGLASTSMNVIEAYLQ
jgi:hypothetical protein